MSTVISMIRVTAGVKRTATVVNDASIASTRPTSRNRLDQALGHVLDIRKENTRCLLHRWVGIESEKNIYYCSTCNVNLCIVCNKPFYEVPELLSLKHAFKRKYNQLTIRTKKEK